MKRKTKEKITQQLYKIGLEIEKEAKLKCPVQTGRLRASIHTKVTKQLEVKVGSNVNYAPDIEFGTQAHTIKPDQAQALRWEDEDGVHFAKEVQHPGTQPQPFLRPAIDKVISKYGGYS